MFEIKWPIYFVLLMLTSQCPLIESACECGRVNRNGKVSGEGDIQTHEFPWIAAIYDNSSRLCTATLINSKYLLTTAYCVRDSGNLGDWSVRLSEHNVNTKGGNVSSITRGNVSFITRRVKQIISHPLYIDEPHKYADIALVKLDRDVELSNVLAPVCLPRSDFNVDGSAAVFVCPKNQTASRNIRLTINDYDGCSIAEKHISSYIQDDKLCAEYQENSKCNTEYGDVLQFRYNNKGAYHLVGLYSYYAIPNSRDERPKIFTKVSHYLRWILHNTQDACSCYAASE